MADNQVLRVPTGASLIVKIGSTEYTLVNSSGVMTLNVTGNVTGNVIGNVTGQTFGTVSSYAADGAIALTDTMAILDGTSVAVAASLADGTAGQRMVIKCTESTNDPVLTPANFHDGSTLTFGTVEMKCELMFDGTDWQIVSNTATLA